MPLQPQSAPLPPRVAKPGRRQRRVQCRQDAVEDHAIAAALAHAGSRQRSCCSSRNAVKIPYCRPSGEEHAVPVHDLADQTQRLGKALAPGLRYGHAPWHGIEAELGLEACGESGVGQIGGEEAVVLSRQQAALVDAAPAGGGWRPRIASAGRPARRYARSSSCRWSRTPNGQAGRPTRRRASRARPTTIVSER